MIKRRFNDKRRGKSQKKFGSVVINNKCHYSASDTNEAEAMLSRVDWWAIYSGITMYQRINEPIQAQRDTLLCQDGSLTVVTKSYWTIELRAPLALENVCKKWLVGARIEIKQLLNWLRKKQQLALKICDFLLNQKCLCLNNILELISSKWQSFKAFSLKMPIEVAFKPLVPECWSY